MALERRKLNHNEHYNDGREEQSSASENRKQRRPKRYNKIKDGGGRRGDIQEIEENNDLGLNGKQNKR